MVEFPREKFNKFIIDVSKVYWAGGADGKRNEFLLRAEAHWNESVAELREKVERLDAPFEHAINSHATKEGYGRHAALNDVLALLPEPETFLRCEHLDVEDWDQATESPNTRKEQQRSGGEKLVTRSWPDNAGKGAKMFTWRGPVHPRWGRTTYELPDRRIKDRRG